MEIITLLKKHDWYYMMSDSSRVYNSGRAEAAQIAKLIKQYTKEEILSQIEDEGLKKIIIERYY